MVQRCQNHRKTIEVNGGLKKNINHSIALKKLTIVVVYTGGKKPFSCSQCEVTMDSKKHFDDHNIAIQGKKITKAMNVKVHL